MLFTMDFDAVSADRLQREATNCYHLHTCFSSGLLFIQVLNLNYAQVVQPGIQELSNSFVQLIHMLAESFNPLILAVLQRHTENLAIFRAAQDNNNQTRLISMNEPMRVHLLLFTWHKAGHVFSFIILQILRNQPNRPRSTDYLDKDNIMCSLCVPKNKMIKRKLTICKLHLISNKIRAFGAISRMIPRQQR